MKLTDFLLMRNELLLVGSLLLILIAEIFSDDNSKKNIIYFSLFLFGIITFTGFLPSETGTLFGGMFVNSDITIFMKNVLNIGVLIILLQSVNWLKKDNQKNKIAEYFLLIISTLIGMNFMISSGNFLMLYIGLEMATIPLAALVAFEIYRSESAEAGIKLILSSALSSGVLLFGLSMIYGMSGSLYFPEVALTFTSNLTSLHVLAFIFFFAGLAFKISLVPFHLWTADVYQGAPTNIASYLSVISKGAAVFILMICLFVVFKGMAEVWKPAVYSLAILTMTVGNLFALRQENLQRFLAFSSIAQAGFILLGLLDNTSLGMSSVVYFILIYIFSNLGAFGVVSIIYNQTGKINISDYNGLYKTNPKLSLALMLSLFSLAGIPPVAGFFGKFFLFTAAAHQSYYWLVFIALINATVSLYYYLMVIKAMFINQNDNPISTFKSDIFSTIGLLICVLGLFAIGFIGPLFDFIRNLSF